MRKWPYVLSAAVGLISVAGQVISTLILDKQTERIAGEVNDTYRKFEELNNSVEEEEDEEE